MNSAEVLAHVADWLGWTDENLSHKLRTPEDGLKLYRYWHERQDKLPEFPDDWHTPDLIAALGYNPILEPDHDHYPDIEPGVMQP